MTSLSNYPSRMLLEALSILSSFTLGALTLRFALMLIFFLLLLTSFDRDAFLTFNNATSSMVQAVETFEWQSFA